MDGQHWVIRPSDSQASEAVAELRRVMRLEPGDHGREIHVAAGWTLDGAFGSGTDKGPLLCPVPHRLNRALEVIQMETIASFVAQAALRQEALLLHGALAEYCGSGFVMAGPGTVGKSTASFRLPSPWRSLCDDMTLVVRDDRGQYWAHPWPTWSRLRAGERDCSWAVEQAIPLRALFFLSRSPSDRLEPVSTTQATALTLDSAVNLPRAAPTPLAGLQSSVPLAIHAARALAAAVPAYSLKLSLDGRFWEEIERVLPETGDRRQETGDRVPPPGVPARVPAEGSTMEPSRFADGSLRVVYTGNSMCPAFQEPELLEVTPYGTGRVRPGDVVCSESPEMRRTIVRRVVAVERRETEDGRPEEHIRTRGDNTGQDDPWVLQAGDIIGRVTAAWRGARRRRIPGGWRGSLAVRFSRLRRHIRSGAGFIGHALHKHVAGLGPFDHLLPRGLRPRLVRFDARQRVFLKLLNDRQTVGQYDDGLQNWCIRRPFWFFVDEQALRDAGSIASRSEPGHMS